MMRIAACAIMGLGAALLVAALLLSTYTAGKIAKIPLDVDVTLISNGSGAALDPESLGVNTRSSTRMCRWCRRSRSVSRHPPTPTW